MSKVGWRRGNGERWRGRKLYGERRAATGRTAMRGQSIKCIIVVKQGRQEDTRHRYSCNCRSIVHGARETIQQREVLAVVSMENTVPPPQPRLRRSSVKRVAYEDQISLGGVAPVVA